VVLGRPAADFVHPDELDRIAGALLESFGGFIPRAFANYRIRNRHGEHVESHVAAWAVDEGPEPAAVAISLRPAVDEPTLDDLLRRLLANEPAAEVLAALLPFLLARHDRSDCTIAFLDEDDRPAHVGSTVPQALLGDVAVEPWATAASTGDEVHLAVDDLPEPTRSGALEAGYASCWVLPVRAEALEPLALVTVWTAPDGPPPVLNRYAVDRIVQFTELALRWRRQAVALEAAATSDHLTGLPNRRAIEALDPARHHGVLYIDLDHFKPVNDRYGHDAGDRVLQIVADRLRAAVRPGDLVARLGGDEFGAVCTDCSGADLDAVAERVRAAVAEPIEGVAPDGQTVGVRASIGVAEGVGPLRHLLSAADAALFDAKADGRDGIRRATTHGDVDGDHAPKGP
jgi:diguanylate cyclase (GGDEF)-like protein